MGSSFEVAKDLADCRAVVGLALVVYVHDGVSLEGVRDPFLVVFFCWGDVFCH